MDKELLVVRSKINLKPSEYNNVQESLAFQKTTGVILLPSYLEAIVVPKDVEIKVENDVKESKKYNPVEKAYNLLLEFHNKNRRDMSQMDVVFEEVIGCLGEALG